MMEMTPAGYLQIVAQDRTVVGMHTVLDDGACPLHGCLVAQVGYTLLRHDDAHTVSVWST